MDLKELILDKVRSATTHDLADGKINMRLTSIEDPSIQCTAEGDEIVDALGSPITTLYRAKSATFTGSNSLINLDLASSQFGTKKDVGSSASKIITKTFEVIKIKDGKVKLSHKPVDDVAYIYSLANNDIGTAYKAGAAVSATQFVVDDDGVIETPTGLEGKVYVEYFYETDKALKISNRASNFPEAVGLTIYALFRDKCNENIKYSGVIICPKVKLNPEQIELSLVSTGKHGFEFKMMKDYCADEGEDELFKIIVAED